jgi:hypothetical protein
MSAASSVGVGFEDAATLKSELMTTMKCALGRTVYLRIGNAAA